MVPRHPEQSILALPGTRCMQSSGQKLTPQLYESAGGLPRLKLPLHSCSLAGSTSAMEVSIPIAFVLPGREHECNESFKLGRPPALSSAYVASVILVEQWDRIELVDHGKLLKLMQFLMGLNDIYQPIRSSLLTREILLEVKDAFVIISREESHIGIPPSSVIIDLVDVSGLKLIVGHPNGSLAKITDVGNLKLNNDVIVFNVLVVPEYTVSLGRVMRIGSEIGGLYLFDKEYNKSVVSNNSKFFACHVSKEVWHYRLGHPANHVLKLVKGSLNLINVDHNGPCEVYHKAKQTSDTFPLSENKSTIFGQLIHLDVWDPYKVVSREGFIYFLTVVYDFSRSVLVYLLKIKDEVFRMFASFYNLVFTQFNKKVKVIRLHFSLVYNKEPNLSHLRSFGFLCFAAIVKASDKFAEKSKKCVLIGYASGKKAYKLFSLENRSVLYSRDVKFYETIFSYKISVQFEVKQSLSKSNVTHLNFFDCVDSETKANSSPSTYDDEEWPSGRDGSVHQPGTDFGNQVRHDGYHTSTPIKENTLSEGTLGLHQEVLVIETQEVPVYANVFHGQTKEASLGLKRSSKSFKLSAKLNDPLSLLLFKEASKDPNWVNVMNDEMHALYENDTWYKARLVAKGMSQKEVPGDGVAIPSGGVRILTTASERDRLKRNPRRFGEATASETLRLPYHGLDLWLQFQIFYDHVDYATQMAIDYAAGGRHKKLREEVAWETIKNLAQYEGKGWNDPIFPNKGSPDYIEANLE
ncbi:ribonuclease H-like domain-containing protein [Tanacetum coccineum]